MKKNYFNYLSLVLILCIGFALPSCSDDDEKTPDGGKSTLTVDGKAVEIADLEAEYIDDSFYFWINDAASTNKRVYIQANFEAKESIDAGTDITSKFEVLFQRNGGSEWFVGDRKDSDNTILGNGYNAYRSGSVQIFRIKFTDC